MKTISLVLLAILGLLVLLLVIALIRTLFLRSSPAGQPKPCAADEQQLQAIADRFGSLLKIETLSKNENEDLSQFDRLHDQIDQLFPLCTAKLSKTVLNGTLLYRWPGKDSSALPLLLMGHQDVVPADGEGWTLPPFAGAVSDGKLYGRGTLDDKCNLFTQMSAIEQLLQEGFVPPCDIWLEYSINEEISGRGAANAVRWFADKGIRFAAVMDEGGAVIDRAMAGMDRPYAMVGVTEKGYIDLKFTARGNGGHSSTPKKVTPVTRLTSFMNEVNTKQPFRRGFSPEVKQMFTTLAPSFSFGMRYLMGNLWLFEPLLVAVMPKISPAAGALLGTTCCFTMMHGSDSTNVIPSEAYVVANLRTGFQQNVDESIAVMKLYADKYHLDMEILSQREASPVTDSTTPIFQYLTKCIAACFPDCGCAPYVMTGGTDCRHYTALSSNCLRFAPIRMSAAQMASCHGIDECVDLTSLADAIAFYRYFIEHYPAA